MRRIVGIRDATGTQNVKRREDKKPTLSNASEKSPLFEIALVLVRLDHVASVIVKTNHSIV